MSITETENRQSGAVSGNGANGASAEKREKPRLRLEYLDGLRGLAALYVVFFHAHLAATYRVSGVPEWTLLAMRWADFGRYAVSVFIVLSGYCLMLPVARSADGQLRGGFWPYIHRRARRILPPYFVALLLSWAVIALVPGLNRETGFWWDHALPAGGWGNILSHLLLLHNFSPDWLLKINGSFWSVATEWQIYFVFPALLLPVWRRFGLIPLLVVAFAVGLAPHFLLPPGHNLDGAAFWFTGLFAMGMAGAVVGFSTKPSVRFWRERMPWGLFSALCLAVFAGVALLHTDWIWGQYVWAMDIVVGGAAISLILYCTRCVTDRPEAEHPDILHILSHRWTVLLGTFSYSLYLVHAPVLGALHLAVRTLHLAPAIAFGVMFGVGVPLALCVSYLFHLAFERRFMPGHPHTARQAAKSAALSPAP